MEDDDDDDGLLVCIGVDGEDSKGICIDMMRAGNVYGCGNGCGNFCS